MFRESQIEILSSLNVEPGRAPATLFESLTLDSAAVSIPTARQTLYCFPGAYLMLQDDPNSGPQIEH
jgi:hypothetical protein